MPALDSAFTGSIPKLYDSLMVPMIFETYADDLVERLAGLRLGRVLEVAAGTGVVTRALADALPASVGIVATDLNPAMLEQARQLRSMRPVQWQQADALSLPFPDATFDAVVCQFGAMFFPDKALAFAQARRVLKPGGIFLFNVWDRIAENEFAETVGEALALVFPDDPPRFMERIPHGYYERAQIERDLSDAGFSAPIGFATVTARSRAPSARSAAIAYCQGTPLRSEIEARDPARLGAATDAAETAIAARFGPGPLDGKIQAHVVWVER